MCRKCRRLRQCVLCLLINKRETPNRKHKKRRGCVRPLFARSVHLTLLSFPVPAVSFLSQLHAVLTACSTALVRLHRQPGKSHVFRLRFSHRSARRFAVPVRLPVLYACSWFRKIRPCSGQSMPCPGLFLKNPLCVTLSAVSPSRLSRPLPLLLSSPNTGSYTRAVSPGSAGSTASGTACAVPLPLQITPYCHHLFICYCCLSCPLYF